jgi:hypothetical protein
LGLLVSINKKNSLFAPFSCTTKNKNFYLQTLKKDKQAPPKRPIGVRVPVGRPYNLFYPYLSLFINNLSIAYQ